MKAVFGLGNPGLAYGLTRHNVGFQAVDLYRKVHRLKKKGRIESSALVYSHNDLLLVKPMTYMNASGPAVRGVLQRHGLSPADAIVIYDDLDLAFGRIRVLEGGGPGSHNGMRSVVRALQTDAIPRLRVGIEQEGRTKVGRDYVTDRFTPDEWQRIVPVLEDVVRAIDVYRDEGLQAAMNRFNRRD